MFLTRVQYDYLVEKYPNWMAENWASLSRDWGARGVEIGGSMELIRQIDYWVSFRSATYIPVLGFSIDKLDNVTLANSDYPSATIYVQGEEGGKLATELHDATNSQQRSIMANYWN